MSISLESAAIFFAPRLFGFSKRRPGRPLNTDLPRKYACWGGSLSAAAQCIRRPMMLKNSSRVASLLKNAPVKSDVVVTAFCFWTPRICMHMC